MRVHLPQFVGNVMLCTDVIQDRTNKFSIIGSYTNDVIVEAFPAQIRFALYIELFHSRVGEVELKLRMLLDKQPMLAFAVKGNVQTKNECAPLALPNLEVNLAQPAILQVDISKDGKWLPLLKKEIKVGVIDGFIKYQNATDVAPPPLQ